MFFDEHNQPKVVQNSRGKLRQPGTKDINYYLRCNEDNFINFISKCLKWEASKRMTPSEALVDE